MMLVGTGFGGWFFYALIGLGICALMVRRAVVVWNRSRSTEGPRAGAPRPRSDVHQADGRSWDAVVFRLAESRGGCLTVSDFVVASDVAVAEAERILDSISDGVRVKMTVTDDGLVRYEFPEIVDRVAREAEEGVR